MRLRYGDPMSTQTPSTPPVILAIDVGGTHVKFRTSAADEARRFESGATLTAAQMCAQVASQTADWTYDRVSVGYPGSVLHGRPVHEPQNLAAGWVGFDFATPLARPVKLINDAAMQALGSYNGGKMLFLGLGTGLGSALIVDGIVEPMGSPTCPTASAPTKIMSGCEALNDSARRSGANTWIRWWGCCPPHWSPTRSCSAAATQS